MAAVLVLGLPVFHMPIIHDVKELRGACDEERENDEHPSDNSVLFPARRPHLLQDSDMFATFNRILVPEE